MICCIVAKSLYRSGRGGLSARSRGRTAGSRVEGTIIERSDARLEQASERLRGASSMDEVVAILRATARGIAASDGIAVVLREAECCHYVAEDAIRPLWRGRRFPLEACISGWAMLNRRTVVVPDLERDPRVPVAAYAATAMRSLAIMPIGSPEPVAALGAYWCAYVEPDAETIARLEALAAAAGAAIVRIRHIRELAGFEGAAPASAGQPPSRSASERA